MRVPVTQLLHHVVREFSAVPPFDAYLDPDRILVLATRGRRGPNGRRAACHFSRFRESGGRVSGDGRFEIPRVEIRGREMLYLLSFVLPRFLFLSREEQLEDVVHELLHIDASFSGIASPLRHGRRYDALVRDIAGRGRERGIEVPSLSQPGAPVYYHRLRPFPQPVRAGDRRARRGYHEADLELAALTLDPGDREPAPPRFLYRCPACGELYPRQRPLRMASCGSCAPTYDGRFKLRLVPRH